MPQVDEIYKREGPETLVDLYILTDDGTIYYLFRYLGADQYITVEVTQQGQILTENTVVRQYEQIEAEAVDVAVHYEELAGL